MEKKYRIKKNEEFQAVFRNGESFANRQFVVYFLKKPNQDYFRLGLSVSKKIGNAVTRNRVKRYVREAFHQIDEEIRNSYDYVIIARKPTSNMDFHEVKSSLIHVMKRSKLLKTSRG
ncbi:ribonuclease P protein component [Pseudalkalibacillus sp. Hm43]|uniref:ribonuclease P protein component n=1 Tax=Pseudalkalibacillus sp. Hm43 TaxID=3450742 RepID=UPI003F43D30B